MSLLQEKEQIQKKIEKKKQNQKRKQMTWYATNVKKLDT